MRKGITSYGTGCGGSVSGRMSHIVPSRWRGDTGLNVHTATEDKGDGTKDAFCEESERVFDQFRKYHTNTLLADFSARLGKTIFFFSH